MATLSPDLLHELAFHNPIGPPLPVEDVEAWWDDIEPRFNARGYRGANRRRALLSWWSRVDELELERVRDRWKRIRAYELEKKLELAPPPPPPPAEAVQAHGWRLRG